MVKCILKGLSQSDPYSGKMQSFETVYNGIPEACSMWASGYKHCFLEECHLYYENGLEVPDRITDYYYDRYYYGRFIFDENGEEIGHSKWTFVHLSIYYPSFSSSPPQVNAKKVGILNKNW